MGFFTAIPIGASQIEIAKRSLNGHIRAALMVVLGSVTSDVMYGGIAFFGIAPFLKDPVVIASFWLIGAIILLVLSAFTLKQNGKSQRVQINHSVLENKQLSFVTGFLLAITNPMMIFWWLIGAKILKDLGLVYTFNSKLYLFFLFFGGLGLASYLTTLAGLLHWVKRYLTEKMMRRTNFSLGLVLIIFSVYFFISSLRIFLK